MLSNSKWLFYRDVGQDSNGEATKTSLLRRLQAHTLFDATPPLGEIHCIIKIAVTFEPEMPFKVFNKKIKYFIS